MSNFTQNTRGGDEKPLLIVIWKKSGVATSEKRKQAAKPKEGEKGNLYKAFRVSFPKTRMPVIFLVIPFSPLYGPIFHGNICTYIHTVHWRKESGHTGQVNTEILCVDEHFFKGQRSRLALRKREWLLEKECYCFLSNRLYFYCCKDVQVQVKGKHVLSLRVPSGLAHKSRQHLWRKGANGENALHFWRSWHLLSHSARFNVGDNHSGKIWNCELAAAQTSGCRNPG